MNALELDSIFAEHGWDGNGFLYRNYSVHEGYTPPTNILYALVESLKDTSLLDINNDQVPYWIGLMAKKRAEANYQDLHKFDAVKRNKSITQLLKEYNTKGKKVKARVELKERIAYAAFSDQKKVICAFLDNVPMDRLFALKFLDTHWDEFYMSFVEKVWRLFHEMQAARVITHHFPTEFIINNQSDLIADYCYLQVRLRLPASYPVDKAKLSTREYLYLCARQAISITDVYAEKLFYQEILDHVADFFYNEHIGPSSIEKIRKNGDLLNGIRVVNSMIWSLGMLGKTKILLQFIDFQRKVSASVIDNNWEEVRKTFENLPSALDFSSYDKVIQERTHRQQKVKNYNTCDENFDWDAYIDDAVEVEQAALDRPF